MLSSRHMHSAVCYALMSLHMLDDYLNNTAARFITGVIMDACVSDGPELKITPLEELRKSVERILEAIQVVRND